MQTRELTHIDDLVEGDDYSVTVRINGHDKIKYGTFVCMKLSPRWGCLVLRFVCSRGRMRTICARDFRSAIKREDI